MIGEAQHVEAHDTIPAGIEWTYARYREAVLGIRTAAQIVEAFDLADDIEAGDWLCLAEDRAFLAIGDDTELPESWRAFHDEALHELAGARKVAP